MNAVFEKRAYFELTGSTTTGIDRYAPMFHPHGELVYVMEGTVPITVDGVSYTLKQGELAILFPYLVHAYESAPDAKAIILLFDPAATAFDNTLLKKKPVNCCTPAENLFPMLERAVFMHHAGRSKTAVAYLNAVIGELLEMIPISDRGDISGDTTIQILSYCAEHCTEDITVKHIADALYISQSYVSKVFSKKLRYSFREYINSLRISKVQSLLRDTDKKILQIMSECGFQNQSSFNRVFRDLTGLSPKEYRTVSRNHK